MASTVEINDVLHRLDDLLRDISEHLADPSRANRRAAALKLERIVAIASTLAATIHTPRQ
ncbi:MAG: hypothetical protein ACKVP7_13145 [Hyphomicrobiaceae bacterium]